jgi:hypothetical protein
LSAFSFLFRHTVKDIILTRIGIDTFLARIGHVRSSEILANASPMPKVFISVAYIDFARRELIMNSFGKFFESPWDSIPTVFLFFIWILNLWNFSNGPPVSSLTLPLFRDTRGKGEIKNNAKTGVFLIFPIQSLSLHI